MKKLKIIIAVLAAVLILAMPAAALAASRSDAIDALKKSGLPDYLVSLASNLSKTAKLSSADWDYAIKDINKASKILDGRKLSALSNNESVKIIKLAADALKHCGYSLKYSWAKKGANITLYDTSGDVIAKFNTRDTGVKQTGEASPYLLPLAICLAALAASAVVVSVRRKQHEE